MKGQRKAMSRKHNTKHQRVRSKYPQRLQKRHLSNVDVRMDDLETLRRRAARENFDNGDRAIDGIDRIAS